MESKIKPMRKLNVCDHNDDALCTTNLLEETLECMRVFDVGVIDVNYVYVQHRKITWNEFESLAKTIWYDEGYGGRNIHPSLTIVGKLWLMTRWEYDGSEGWEFNDIDPGKDLPFSWPNQRDILLDLYY